MVNPNTFKRKIESILTQNYKIEFLGTNFDKIVKSLTEPKASKIQNWIKQVINNNIRPINPIKTGQ
ncbi:hypothetical protein K9L97_03845 [Candidatus Woesearchaeota archaeon]|nr:hypothetical protein [Candidatus Woesearchaeota archaeon]